MLQFPAFMTQFPSSERMIPASLLLQHQLSNAQSDDELLALEESEYLDKLNEFKKLNSNIVVIGKTKVDNDKEDIDNDAEDDDDADNAEESEGEFEQETA
ncbi:putative transporter arsB [Bienertia sinuspersici]